MENIAKILQNNEASTLINENYFFKGFQIDWDFVLDFQKFNHISELLNFLEKEDFQEIFYVNDYLIEEEFLVSRKHLAEFINFALSECSGYHYFTIEKAEFIIFIYNENEIFFGRYNPIKKVISLLKEKIQSIENQLKTKPENKTELITEKKSLQEAIFQIGFCQKNQIFRHNLRMVHHLETPDQTGFSNLKIMCDNETSDPKYWSEIQNLDLYDGDLIIQKK